jgi:3alpha(or 20beta)-hydroxysteroid dehydrogenase
VSAVAPDRPPGGRLAGKVAVITGAARGQGEAEARLFVTEGASVVLTDVLADEGRTVAKELGDAARFVRHDVASEPDWERVMATAADAFGPVTVLVNNAAIHWLRAIEDETLDGFGRILSVNLLGTFLGIRSAIAPMRAAGGGSVVNISSIAGMTGLAWHGAYGSAKWGVRGLTKTAAVELGPDGIRVNSVHPGPIATAMMSPVRADEPDRFAQLPLRRAGQPVEAAELVLWLASDASSYVTGAEFVIDGGSTAGRQASPRPT